MSCEHDWHYAKDVGLSLLFYCSKCLATRLKTTKEIINEDSMGDYYQDMKGL